jgi:helicase MOV-10
MFVTETSLHGCAALLPEALVCLAGDVKQLGPLVKSKLATDHGFQVSLMERLFTRLTKEHSRVFVLTDTYRSHPSILKLGFSICFV